MAMLALKNAAYLSLFELITSISIFGKSLNLSMRLFFLTDLICSLRQIYFKGHEYTSFGDLFVCGVLLK